MRLHTPVLLPTQDPGLAALARTRGWRTVTQEGLELRLDRVDETLTTPEERMDMLTGSLQPPMVWQWSHVLAWLGRHVHHPLLVVGPGSPLVDLALWAHRALGWPHAVVVDRSEPLPPRTPSGLAVVSSAVGAWRVLGPSMAAQAEDPVTHLLPELPATSLVGAPVPHRVPDAVHEPGMARVLVAAHHPTARVRAWLGALTAVDGIAVDLVHAAPWPDAPARSHHVHDLGPAEAAADRGGAVPAWGTAHLAHVRDSLTVHPQLGAFWHIPLEQYFAHRSDDFDVVICAGPPFAWFDFAKYAQRRWYARTVLDHREPLALGTDVGRTQELRGRAAYLERGLNLGADRITVPDARGADSVVDLSLESRAVVVPDGPSGADAVVALVRELADHSYTHPL